MKQILPLLALCMVTVFATVSRGDDISISIAINERGDPPAGGKADGALEFMGKDSKFHIVLTNMSDKPVSPWAYRDGNAVLIFVFTDVHGNRSTITRKADTNAKFITAMKWWTLGPGDRMAIDIDFKEWEGFPDPGEQKFLLGMLEAIYIRKENAVSKAKLVRFYSGQ